MKKMIAAMATLVVASLPFAAHATPEQDLKEFRAYYKQKFPSIPFQDYANGVYAIDPQARAQWQEMEEFPPYELNISKGEELFNTPFANGKTYASCFKNGGKGIKQNYPYFDSASGQVKTLELEINECRTKNGEKPLAYGKGDLADISAYMAYTSRGKKIDVKVPNDPRALEWYEKGKAYFYAKRGQLNFACADCHIGNVGMVLRTEVLGPALGQTSHWPAYRIKWGGMGTLQRRYTGCNDQVRTKAYPLQSEGYRALEYFHTYMSNGIEINGPGLRK